MLLKMSFMDRLHVLITYSCMFLLHVQLTIHLCDIGMLSASQPPCARAVHYDMHFTQQQVVFPCLMKARGSPRFTCIFYQQVQGHL